MSVLSSLPPPNETERELGEVVREVVSALAPPNGTGIPCSRFFQPQDPRSWVSFSVSLQKINKKKLVVARDPSQHSLMERRGHAALVTMVAMVVVAGIRAESSVEALKNKQLYSDAMYGDSAAVACLLYTSPSPRDGLLSRMPSSA